MKLTLCSNLQISSHRQEIIYSSPLTPCQQYDKELIIFLVHIVTLLLLGKLKQIFFFVHIFLYLFNKYKFGDWLVKLSLALLCFSCKWQILWQVCCMWVEGQKCICLLSNNDIKIAVLQKNLITLLVECCCYSSIEYLLRFCSFFTTGCYIQFQEIYSWCFHFLFGIRWRYVLLSIFMAKTAFCYTEKRLLSIDVRYSVLFLSGM